MTVKRYAETLPSRMRTRSKLSIGWFVPLDDVAGRLRNVLNVFPSLWVINIECERIFLMLLFVSKVVVGEMNKLSSGDEQKDFLLLLWDIQSANFFSPWNNVFVCFHNVGRTSLNFNNDFVFNTISIICGVNTKCCYCVEQTLN